jgi:hypothetical protein
VNDLLRVQLVELSGQLVDHGEHARRGERVAPTDEQLVEGHLPVRRRLRREVGGRCAHAVGTAWLR